MRSTGWAIVLDFEGGGSRPGKQSHEAAGIHQAFQQHGSCMAADRASAAGGDAGDRIAQRRLGRALAISRSRVPATACRNPVMSKAKIWRSSTAGRTVIMKSYRGWWPSWSVAT